MLWLFDRYLSTVEPTSYESFIARDVCKDKVCRGLSSKEKKPATATDDGKALPARLSKICSFLTFRAGRTHWTYLLDLWLKNIVVDCNLWLNYELTWQVCWTKGQYTKAPELKAFIYIQKVTDGSAGAMLTTISSLPIFIPSLVSTTDDRNTEPDTSVFVSVFVFLEHLTLSAFV